MRPAAEPRLSPDGSLVTFVVQTVAPGQDGYYLVARRTGLPPLPKARAGK